LDGKGRKLVTHFGNVFLDINHELAACCEQTVVLILAAAGEVEKGDALRATATMKNGSYQWLWKQIDGWHRALTFHVLDRIA
jgi:hypothetical protein